MSAVKRILRYVKGTLDYGLVYPKGRGHYLLEGYSDSDLEGSIEDRRSTGGMAFYLDECLITGFRKNRGALLCPRARLSSWQPPLLLVNEFGWVNCSVESLVENSSQ